MAGSRGTEGAHTKGAGAVRYAVWDMEDGTRFKVSVYKNRRTFGKYLHSKTLAGEGRISAKRVMAQFFSFPETESIRYELVFQEPFFAPECVAHEVAHMMVHRHGGKDLSKDADAQERFAEESGEVVGLILGNEEWGRHPKE